MSATFSIRFVNCIVGAPKINLTQARHGRIYYMVKQVSWSVKLGIRALVATGYDNGFRLPLTYNVGANYFAPGEPVITRYAPTTELLGVLDASSRSGSGANVQFKFPSFDDAYSAVKRYTIYMSPYRADASWQWVFVPPGKEYRWDLRFSGSEEQSLYPTWQKVS